MTTTRLLKFSFPPAWGKVRMRGLLALLVAGAISSAPRPTQAQQDVQSSTAPTGASANKASMTPAPSRIPTPSRINPALVESELHSMKRNFSGISDSKDAIDAASWASIPNLDRLVKFGKPASPIIMKWFSDKSMPGPMRELLGEEVLPYIVDRSDIKDLARIANDPHENPLVRAAAVRSLGAIGSKSATQAIEAVKGSSGAQHAIEIEKIRALGKSGAKDGIPYLLTELNSNDDYTRVAAASSLESIAVKSREPSIANPVRQMLYDKSFQYKPAVISLLGNSGDRESIPELGDLLKDRAQTYSTRFMAAMALGKLGGKESAQILMSEAEDKTETDEGVRALSAEAAVKAGVDPDKAPILEGVLVTIKDPYLRKRLSGAIQQLKSRR